MKRSLTEAVQKGVSVTAVGVIIVFSVLIVLMVTMIIMKMVFYRQKTEKNEAKEVAKVNTSASVVAPTSMQDRNFAKEVKDENTLIAIFASAIAASLDTQVESIKIHSYRCINK